MGKLFGTDGVRGVAGRDLTCELAMQIGRATAAVLTGLDGHRPRILIGKDTRVSGDMLECTLAAGLCSVGADVDLLGVIPTPGVAYLVRQYGADAGIVISASHNPMEFNGIKIFKGDGYKLPNEVENEIERHIFNGCKDIKLCEGAGIGRVRRLDCAVDDYVDALQAHIDADLSGLNVLFDCANGASAKVAQKLFPRLGCQCGFIGTRDDGVSVNDGCGSTHLETLEKAVVAGGYDCGIAFDGDADRCLAVDEKGGIITGDHILYVCGKYMKDSGILGNKKIVTTVMSNLGLYKALDEIGIGYEKTAVGDKYVAENMRSNGHILGGEQSGHIIFGRLASSGDGLLTAIKIMEAMCESKQPLSVLASPVVMYPQVLKNVVVDDKDEALNDPEVKAEVEKIGAELGSEGRVLLRKSGTEPLLRIMVEAGSAETCNACVDRIIEAMKRCGRLIAVK